MAQHAPAITHYGLGSHGSEGDDLADLVAAVSSGHVVDHQVTFFHAKIDIEIRHGDAFRVKKAFEQQFVNQWIQVSNSERVGYQRACARAAARPDRDVVFFRPVDEIGNDQEVTRESHGIDHAQFEVQTRRVILFRVPLRCSVLLQPVFQARF